MPSADMVSYYAQRAPEYERIYAIPERQEDLQTLRELVRETFAGRNVLDVACGTGYWTEILVKTASSVFATDINDEVLEIARAKARILESVNVRFLKSDAYMLEGAPRSNASLVAFWWSHIPKQRIREFLDSLHSKLDPGSIVLIIDNSYVPGSSTPIHRRDDDGNTYQLRKLQDGSMHEVLKNFPTEAELQAQLCATTKNLHVRLLKYYWSASYEL